MQSGFFVQLALTGYTDSLFRAQNDFRIINGIKVDGVIRRVPWIFSFRKDDRHICAASFISPNISSNGKIKSWSTEARNPVWAVTAAHCVVDENGNLIDPKRFSVWSGVLDISGGLNNSGGEVQKVMEIFIPQSSENIGAYNLITQKNDIALLRLSDSKNELGSQRISIRFPSIQEVSWIYDPYTAVYTSGWGRTETGASSDQLLEVRMPLVDKTFCQVKYDPYGDIISQGMICAGHTSGEYDSCQGDSGGPLYYRPSERLGRTAEPVLIGIVSWGRGCGATDLFGVYTSITFYENWIKSKIEKHH